MSNIQVTSLFLSQKFTNFLEIAEAVHDPRMDRCKRHELSHMIVMIIFGILSGANGQSAIKRFIDRERESFLSALYMPFGLPSRVTLGRALAIIHPNDLVFWISYWQQNDDESDDGEHIAIDGKEDNANEFYCLRAMNVNNGQIIAHEKIADDSNEIPAMHELLKKINIEKKIITADAIHNQRKTARQIVNQNGDYVLVLKANQHQIYEDVKLYLDDIEHNDDLKNTYLKYETLEKSRNRIEKRICISTGSLGWLYRRNQWKKLSSISAIDSTRIIKNKTTKNKLYILSSLKPDALRISKLVRNHWSIENRCHWQLDNHFNADRSTFRDRFTTLNFAILRDCALSLLQRMPSNEPLNEKRITFLYQVKDLLKVL